ncbi:MAG: PQQ-binding-like beta-propeller repeat protein [Gemmataceae bacterium]
MQLFIGILVIAFLPGQPPESGRAKVEAQDAWPQWRGPLGTGVAPKAEPPVEWGENKNVRWKTPLPGKGHSTPVVWGDHIFLTTAIPYGEPIRPRVVRPGAHDNLAMTFNHEFAVLAVSRKTGKILWQRTVHKAAPHEAGHQTASLASASPITDGEHVFACLGSYGLYCLDFEGNLVWKKDLGEMYTKHGHGEGSSPALHGDTLVVNCDQEEQSFLIALDKNTGKQRWRVSRPEDTSWATPIVVEVGGRAQVVVPGTNRVRGYDVISGDVVWECGGLSSNIVASPVAADGVVYTGSSYDTRAMLAIRLAGANGDITGTAQVVWLRRRGTPYVPSPLLYGDVLYNLVHYQGLLARIDVKTGNERGEAVRMPAIREVYASPVGAAGRIYITSREGVTQVLSHGEAWPKTLAVNRLDDSFSASPALAGRELFLRGERHLYCLAAE